MKIVTMKKHIKLAIYDERAKMCFLSTAVTGILCYLYFIVNNLNNHDNIATTPEYSASGVRSGRWLLNVFGDISWKIWGDYNIPLFTGGLAVVFLAFCSLFLVHIFNINNRCMCCLISAITVAFPPVASAMIYSFTVHYYMLAILFGILGVYVLQKIDNMPKLYQRSFVILLASVLYACSLGIYQAYFPFIAALLVLRLIQICLDDEINWKTIFFRAIYYFSSLILGYLVYRLILKISLLLYHTELGEYKGINNMGKIDLHQLPSLLRDTYNSYIKLCKTDYCSINSTRVLKISILLICLIAFVSLIFIWKNRDIFKVIEMCVLVSLLPLASHAIIIMAPSQNPNTLVAYGTISIFYLPIVIFEKLNYNNKDIVKKLSWGAIMCIITFSVLNYAWLSNGNYRALYYANRKVENYYTTMWSRITSTTGYNENMSVLFIGHNIDDMSFYENWQSTPFQYTGNLSALLQLNEYEYSRGRFIENYLGHAISEITVEQYEQYKNVIKQMDTYPNDLSIKIVDNYVFVKLEEMILE